MKPVLHGHLDSAEIEIRDASSGTLKLRGWFLKESDTIRSITFFYNGASYSVAPQVRSDVADRIKSPSKFLNVGYELSIPLSYVPLPVPRLTISFSIEFLSGEVFKSFLTTTPKLIYKADTIPKDLKDSSLNGYLSLCRIKQENFLAHSGTMTFPAHPDPMLSVIIVSHNQSHLLLNCLASLSSGLPSESEVIIFDNASTDVTKELLKKIEGPKVVYNDKNLHFLRAANAAALEARGKYLLFLNTDIEVLDHAIANALSVFEKNPQCGVVGGMLIAPNGQVQECGGLIFRDGATSPLFYQQPVEEVSEHIVESVDYCSGAFLLTSKELFRDLNGFNTEYSPAYYEDVDFCLKVKAKGFSVLVPSTVKAIHVGRASAVSQEEPDELIRQHHKKFTALNKTLLSDPRLLNYSFDKGTTFSAGILMFDDFLPLPSRGQGTPRSHQVLSMLEEENIKVTMILSHEQEALLLSNFAQYSPRILASEEALFRFFLNAKELPSVWWISRPSNLERVTKVLDKIPNLKSKIKVIYDSEAIYSTRMVLEHELRHNVILSEQEILSIISKEMDIVRSADAVIAVNQLEANTFKDFNIQNISLLSYGIPEDPTHTLNDFHETSGLFCISPCTEINNPNADAAIITANIIYPLVIKLLGTTIPRLSFAGDICPAVLDYLSDPNIRILGLVDKLKDVAQQHRVFIAPHRFGAGIPIKAIEAAYFGVPIVCSDLIALQLGWQDQKEVLIGRTPEEIAAKVAALYSNIDLWRALQKNAYAAVTDQFQLKKFRSSLISFIKRQEFKSYLGL